MYMQAHAECSQPLLRRSTVQLAAGALTLAGVLSFEPVGPKPLKPQEKPLLVGREQRKQKGTDEGPHSKSSHLDPSTCGLRLGLSPHLLWPLLAP